LIVYCSREAQEAAKKKSKLGSQGSDQYEGLDSSDDEPPTDFGDDPPVSVKRIKKKNRGFAVSSESVDPVKLKEQIKDLPRYAKTPEVLTALRRLIERSHLLNALDDEAKALLENTFAGPLSFEAGQNIIMQGEDGEQFYLIEQGSVDVFVRKKDGPEKQVHTYEAGDSFGELAIMYNTPRAATCRASSAVKLWSLDRKSYKVIVVGATLIKREKYVGFLRTIPIFNTLTELEVTFLADALCEERFAGGTAICNEGEAGNYFYIVTKGKATVTKRIPAAAPVEGATEQPQEPEPIVVATLKPGNYFGEVALLTKQPRQATVIADGPLEVLSLDRATFNRILGPLDDILRRNMEAYNKRLAQTI
jgi:cAMP-dependent protein kinase regulator